jgi:tRNA/tmRNA/rRNA uracil-C5-methylase (TrmA/RlmC/RlmD family)
VLTAPDPGQPLQVGVEFELEVERVAHGGHCVGRYDNQVVFIRHSLPGERVVARVTKVGRKNRFVNADAIGVLRAAPGRVVATCRFSGPDGCGGCDWQHVDLSTQRQLKTSVLAEQLDRFANWEWRGEVQPLTENESGRDWRTRVQYSTTGSGKVGFRKYHESAIVPIDTCEIATQGIREAHCGGVNVRDVNWRESRIEVVDPGAGPAVVAQCDGAPAHVRESVLGLSFEVPTRGFWQVHPDAASALAEIVIGWAGNSGIVWDLYSGVGLFAGAVADARQSDRSAIVAVESDARAVESAHRNLSRWPNVRVVRADVATWLAQRPRTELSAVDSVILDPPRKGAGSQVLDRLSQSSAHQLVYVACDPATLGRDTKHLLSLGWELAEARALDLFPMTHHFESVGRFCR